MKRILLTGVFAALGILPAMAADMAPTTYKAPLATPALNWSGFYAGLHAGYVRSDVSVLDNINDGVLPGPFGYRPQGGFAGGQLGVNYQMGSNFLIGVEGDVGFIGQKGKGLAPSSNPAAHQDLTLDSGWYGDITGRAGVVFNSVLIYGKGGYAYFDTDARQTTTNPGFVTTGTGAFHGWVVGGGAEWMFAPNVSAKIEYLHFDFGSRGGMQTATEGGYQFTNNTALTMETVKAGLNYRFGSQ